MGAGFSSFIQEIQQNSQKSQNKVDLSSLLDIEKNYVQSIGVVTPTAQSVKVQPIIDDLIATNTAFENANATTNDILDHQSEMQNILDNEQTRLSQKKQSIEDAITTQQRMIELNDSYQKRYAFFNKIVIITIMVLILLLAVSFLSKYFPIVPDFIISALYVIIISIAIIIIVIYFRDFYNRTNMDFDKIIINNDSKNLSVASSPPTISTPMAGLYDFANQMNICIGPQCCSNGTMWDSKNAICAIVSSPGTTPASPGTTPESAFTLMGGVRPLEGFEYDNYAKI